MVELLTILDFGWVGWVGRLVSVGLVFDLFPTCLWFCLGVLCVLGLRFSVGVSCLV